MWSRLATVLLLCTFVVGVERSLFRLNLSEIVCTDPRVNASLTACVDADCFLLEESADTTSSNSLERYEWNRMVEMMKELSWDRLDDAYPETMSILPPLSRLRQRVCPVKYSPEIHPNRVPRLIMHAKCLHNNCSLGPCKCREVEQYRQVYEPVYGGCSVSGSKGRVLVKKFVNVSVNCAAGPNNAT